MHSRQFSRGQGLIAYAVIIALIVVVTIAVLVLLGPQINACFCGVKQSSRRRSPMYMPDEPPWGIPTGAGHDVEDEFGIVVLLVAAVSGSSRRSCCLAHSSPPCVSARLIPAVPLQLSCDVAA